MNQATGYPDAEDMRNEQLLDPDLSVLIEWLEEDKEPNQQELHMNSPGVNKFWLLKSQLIIKTGVLYYHREYDDSPKYLLMVPRSLRNEVLTYCHNMPRSRQGQTVSRTWSVTPRRSYEKESS